MGQILMNIVTMNEKWKNNHFWILFEKYGKMYKNVRNDKNGSDIDENGQNNWKMKKIIIFGFFSVKYEKISEKVKNDENGSDIDEHCQIE